LTLVGYQVNPEKCKAICIEDGTLSENPLVINNNTKIESLKNGETIKHLGVNFQNAISFNRGPMMQTLAKSLQNLVSTPLLRADQKTAVVNQYIWPTLIFPLQTVPLNKIPKSFLEDLDKITKSSIKEIIGLPKDTPNAMLYTSNKYRGL
jgi:hypothetical protein